MVIARLAIGLLVVLGLGVLVGCATYRTGPQYRPTPQGHVPIVVVEFDDQGRFFDPAQEQHALDLVTAAAHRGGALVTVFVHGWHHNAAPADTNLDGFATALANLKEAADEDVYRKARKRFYGHEEADVVGIYIAWRGSSLPGYLDYLTFWDRKAAAERVGRGDVMEFLTLIDNVCRTANDRGDYTSLVTIGHSFGGQVVTSAIATMLRNRLLLARDGTSFPRLVTGFGDLVVLVNPAVESATFARISTMTRTATFLPMQAPVVFIISSESDGARRAWFPFGRRIGLMGQVFHDGEYDENIRALGWNKSQLTHCLAIEGGAHCREYAARNVEYRGPHFTPQEARQGVAATRYAGVWTEDNTKDITRVQLGGDLGMCGVTLSRLSDDIDPNQPFVVAEATSEVINGHNDMFSPPFIAFLTRYVAGAELKRFAVKRQASQPSP